jgi:hypothetical protein
MTTHFDSFCYVEISRHAMYVCVTYETKAKPGNQDTEMVISYARHALKTEE